MARVLIDAGVALATVLALTSVSGFGILLAPVLLALQWWRATKAGPKLRLLWALLAGATAALLAWGITYVTVGEREPYVWLVPALAFVAGASFIDRSSRARPSDART